MNNFKISKLSQRKELLIKRKKIFESNDVANINLFYHLENSKLFEKSNIIASYFSVNDEIQTTDLNKKLINSGKTLCLPTLTPANYTLSFKILNNNTKMVKGMFNIMEPDKNSKEVIPDLILTPCVAFDKFGYRMGYGGGYYDRTINKLKLKFKELILIIVAFSDQEVPKIIFDEFDQKLDYILTEKKLTKAVN